MDKKKEVMHIFTDGGARGNPGPAATGVVIKDDKGSMLYEAGKYIGETTNNVAEYEAVIQALSWVKDAKMNVDITVFVDSQLVAYQLSGLYKVKAVHLRDLIIKIKILEQEIGGQISYTAIPREKNKEADRMVNIALDKRASLV